MKGRFFIDTNILVYSLLENDSHKHGQAVHLMESLKGNFIFISTQVLNELYVSLQKHNIEEPEIENKIRKIIDIYNVSIINISTIKLCWKVKGKYAYSYWDSLIIAAALENNCSILYTEDMRDGQVIDNKLRIANPFVLKKAEKAGNK
jgi:predicted nucleic acid-binding protein